MSAFRLLNSFGIALVLFPSSLLHFNSLILYLMNLNQMQSSEFLEPAYGQRAHLDLILEGLVHSLA